MAINKSRFLEHERKANQSRPEVDFWRTLSNNDLILQVRVACEQNQYLMLYACRRMSLNKLSH